MFELVVGITVMVVVGGFMLREPLSNAYYVIKHINRV